jgi:hypothetical protein
MSLRANNRQIPRATAMASCRSEAKASAGESGIRVEVERKANYVKLT